MSDVFVFSSPLQYFFASLVCHAHSDGEVSGRQLKVAKDFKDVYLEIDAILNTTIPMQRFDPREVLGGEDRLLLANRFNRAEAAFAWHNGRYGNGVCLYEEGVNLYIRHFYRTDWLHDENRTLAIKNKLKMLAGYPPSHVPISKFDTIYSTFSDIPGLTVGTKHVSLLEDLKSLKRPERGGGSSSCIVLSQWLVEDGLIGLDDYIGYLQDLAEKLEASYSCVYFKEHPRDLGELRERVLNETCMVPVPEQYARVPVELYLAANGSIDVYGFWTSAMFYAQQAFGNRSFTLFPDIVDKFSDVQGLRAMWMNAKPLLDRFGIRAFSEI